MCIFKIMREVEVLDIPRSKPMTAYKVLSIAPDGTFQSPLYPSDWNRLSVTHDEIHGARFDNGTPGIHCLRTVGDTRTQYTSSWCAVIVRLSIWGKVYVYSEPHTPNRVFGYLAQNAKIESVRGNSAWTYALNRLSRAFKRYRSLLDERTPREKERFPSGR